MDVTHYCAWLNLILIPDGSEVKWTESQCSQRRLINIITSDNKREISQIHQGTTHTVVLCKQVLARCLNQLVKKQSLYKVPCSSVTCSQNTKATTDQSSFNKTRA